MMNLLLKTPNRSRILILFGPAGSGKTHFAKQLLKLKSESQIYSTFYEAKRDSHINGALFMTIRSHTGSSYAIQIIETRLLNPLHQQILQDRRNKAIYFHPTKSPQFCTKSGDNADINSFDDVMCSEVDNVIDGPISDVEQLVLSDDFTLKRLSINEQATQVILFGNTTQIVESAPLALIKVDNLVFKSAFNLPLAAKLKTTNLDKLRIVAKYLNVSVVDKIFFRSVEELNFICWTCGAEIEEKITVNFRTQPVFRSKSVVNVKFKRGGLSLVCERCDTVSPFERQFSKETNDERNALLMVLDEDVDEASLEIIREQFRSFLENQNVVNAKFIAFNVFGDLFTDEENEQQNQNSIKFINALYEATLGVLEPIASINCYLNASQLQMNKSKIDLFCRRTRSSYNQKEEAIQLNVPLLEAPFYQAEIFDIFDQNIVFDQENVRWKLLEFHQEDIDHDQMLNGIVDAGWIGLQLFVDRKVNSK